LEWIRHIIWLDLLIIIIILRSTYVGFQRGLFGELLYILGLYVAIIFTLHWCPTVANFFHSVILLPVNFAYIISFILIILAIYIIFVILNKFLRRTVKIEVLPAVNKIGGPIFGFIRGGVISILLCFALLLVPIGYVARAVKTRSLFGPFLIETGMTLYKKSLGFGSAERVKKVEEMIKGVEPIKFKKLQLKQKGDIDRLLE